MPRTESPTRHRPAARRGELAEPDASPLTRHLAHLTATLATEFDVASRRLYRVADVEAGMESPTQAVADRGAKSARRAATQAAKCVSVARPAELRELGWLQGRPRFKVAGSA